MFAYKYWTKEEEEFVIENHGKIPSKEIAKKLNKKLSQVNSKIQYLRERDKLKEPKKYNLIPVEERKAKRSEINLESIKLCIGKKYDIRYTSESNKLGTLYFTGTLVKEYKDYYLFQGKNYLESFRKADFNTGEYKIKEVR